jgi:hypothetical protein
MPWLRGSPGFCLQFDFDCCTSLRLLPAVLLLLLLLLLLVWMLPE